MNNLPIFIRPVLKQVEEQIFIKGFRLVALDNGTRYEPQFFIDNRASAAIAAGTLWPEPKEWLPCAWCEGSGLDGDYICTVCNGACIEFRRP